ncbi:UDP-glucuronic acid decarboxylase family protein [Nonomuraea endophytica]|uniref:UDP-glucuronic acid decarboxylase family protein n=1 Tax=Nonomuraea endophytica TaxID=714136 RepID=UPI0037C897F4
MRVVITGGAGFLGSHLADALLHRGDSVHCVDNLTTGRLANLDHLMGHPRFRFTEHDVTLGLPVAGPVEAVAHLASPASPPDYLLRPLETLAAGSRGTEHAIELARRRGARFVLASTSEIYGSPELHPQPEEYWGHVNPIGPRSVYDEGKRFAEAMTAAYARSYGVNGGIVRIFNTYGPRMSAGDGRVVTNFITQALRGEPLTVYGDGSQTRSFCYVDDLVRGLTAMIDSAEPGPLNLGNPAEFSIAELAGIIVRITGSSSPVRYLPLPQDDPPRRRPVVKRAAEALGWHPGIGLEEGVRRTVAWFHSVERGALL